ncbi:RidA family protein [Chitinophaga lutea]|uniref:RidA family protein n=2 Tax=Chitinophaga lutea TaxID=2488634 RepID=A0A3N4Q217_9BACT|nr:RidA family protein [Chitinophaga lutea]
MMDTLTIKHINPDGLIKNPAFTNVITIQGNAKTIYIGEMNANNAAGEIVGKGDLKAQTEQALKNVETALHAAGGDWENLVKWTVYVVHGQDLRAGFEGFQKVWGNRPNPPVVTMQFVAGLANPDYLVGIEAVAVVPEDKK